MEDILKRLGNVEASVADVRIQVCAIAATIPHLATAASVSDLRSEIKESDTRMIKCFIATSLTVAALAFSIAKLVH